MSEPSGTKKKGLSSPWVVVTLAVVGLVIGLGIALVQSFWIAGPHELSASRAVLDPDLIEKVVAAKDPQPKKMSEAIERALDLTDALLHPGTGTPAGAGTVQERIRVPAAGMEANAGDYAHTYAAVLGTLLNALNINHRISVVRSASASALGRDFGDHHWVYVQEFRTSVMLGHYVDPMLHDRFGRWNVLGHVEEPVAPPIPGMLPSGARPTLPQAMPATP